MKYLCLTLLLGCGSECHLYSYASQFNYRFDFNQTTQTGIKVDTSGQDIDLNELDTLVKETEDCLLSDFSGHLPTDPKADCVVGRLDLPLPCHKCYRVKVAGDWSLSEDGTQQLLPYNAPEELCVEKGLTPDLNHPCKWRGGLEDGVIVSTPNLVVFKDPLVRLITGCNGSWFGGLERCSTK